ncbi:terminase small subunit [Niameybacter massiliensis]|uniref:terminase small subunit n=1 Tax=Niameybacter massiliensis TaxID=1658108 RepID=UPI0009E290B2|nr:terminase small subunit [Niameybacter massiliensis]
MSKITDRQKAFCDYYLELGNATEAYIKAGYNEKGARANASRLIANDSIKLYLEERRKQIESDRIAGPQEVLQYLTKVMRGEEKDQFDMEASLQDRTKCAELLGKRYRMWTDKVEANVQQQVVFCDEQELED